MRHDDPLSTSLRAGPWWVRLLFVVVGLMLWFASQWALGHRDLEGDGIIDMPLRWTSTANRYLHEHPGAADMLLIVSSSIINVLTIFLLAWSVFGRSVRPFLGLLLLFALRQVCQMLVALPAPPGMIWPDGVDRAMPVLPEFLGGFAVPGLLVTYKVANDFFFSGHTALAVYGAIELARLGRRWLVGVAFGIALFEIATVLLLRAHWSMDVITGILAAFCAAAVAEKLAPACDRWLARRSR